MTPEIQKAGILKRIAAALLDIILIGILVTGAAALLAGILGYDGYVKTVDECYARYEADYGIRFEITQDEYLALTETQRQNYDAAAKALSADKTFQQAYSMQMNLMLLITTFSLLFGVMLAEFIAPLLLKNGQTVGKKVMGVAVMRTDGVQIGKLQLFIRALLGKYTVEIMIPVYILIMMLFGTADIFTLLILAALAIGQIVSLAVSRTNALLHDRIAGTVAVEISSQMIFRTKEDLVEYTKKIHAERANRSQY